MRSTRTKLAIALLVIATIGATSAMASDGQFSDVPETGAGSFAHDPAEWAAANGLTTGCNSPGGGVIGDNFCPLDNVTRGQNITFTYRHHTELIEPLLADIESDVADNASAIDSAPRVYFARVSPTGTVEATSTDALTVVSEAEDGQYTVTLPEAADNCATSSTLGFQTANLDDLITIGLIALVNLAYTTSGTHTFQVETDVDEVRVFTYVDDVTDTVPPVLTDLGFMFTAYCSGS
jgi:hypothetical protein